MCHRTSGESLDASAYWAQRLTGSSSVQGAGMRGRGEAFNRWAYRAKLRAVALALRYEGISLRGKAILDVGCGSGQYIPLWLRYDPLHVEGWDLTETSVARLTDRYPAIQFRQIDISEPLPVQGLPAFDLVTALDVLFHIAGDSPFRQALHNLRRLTMPGGHVLLSDYCLEWGTFQPARHVYFRSLDAYESALQDARLAVVGVYPHTYWLNAPLDIHHRSWRALSFWGWTAASRVALVEPFGEALGRFLYRCDASCMGRRARTRATKLIVCVPVEDRPEEGRESPEWAIDRHRTYAV